jgi:phage shock protein C
MREFYRARNGWIFGLCEGVARWAQIDVTWVRLIAIFLLIMTGFWPMIGFYLLAALITKPEPQIEFRNSEEEELYVTYAGSRQHALERLNRRAAEINRRIQRMESIVTSPEHDWQSRLKE